jgi:hypothetical protein
LVSLIVEDFRAYPDRNVRLGWSRVEWAEDARAKAWWTHVEAEDARAKAWWTHVEAEDARAKAWWTHVEAEDARAKAWWTHVEAEDEGPRRPSAASRRAGLEG